MAGTTTNFLWPFPTNPDAALVAGDMQSLASAIDSTLGNAWTSYTPAWTAATVNPAIGNGTIVGRFKQFGKWGIANGQITMGGTTTFGTGDYSFGNPAGWTLNSTVRLRGIGGIIDASSGTNYVGFMLAVSGAASMRVHGSALGVNPTSPITFVSGDVIYWEILVELV